MLVSTHIHRLSYRLKVRIGPGLIGLMVLPIEHVSRDVVRLLLSITIEVA